MFPDYKKIDVFTQLLKGKVKDLRSNMKLKEVEKFLGRNYSITELDFGHQLYYYNYRINFSAGRLDELALIFNKSVKAKYKASINGKGLVIGWETHIHNFLDFLNANEIEWEIKYELSKFEYLIISMHKSNTTAIFYLTSGNLMMIAKKFK